MKATVEFEVNGCHDCIFACKEYAEAIYGYGEICYCNHPEFEETDNPFNNGFVDKCKFPEWCPLIKNKKE